MSPNLAAALNRASGYAQAQLHREVTLEHLLLALTEDADAGQVLEASRVDLGRLNSDVSGHIGRIEDRNPPELADRIVVSNELRRILEAAAAAALKGRRREINGAIVLAAIVGDGRTVAAHMLRAQGLTFEEAIRVLQRAPAAPPRSAPQHPPQHPPTPQPGMRPAPMPPPSPHPAPQQMAPSVGQSQQPMPPRAPSAEEIIASARERVQQHWVEPPAQTARHPEPHVEAEGGAPLPPSGPHPEPPPAAPAPLPFEPRFEPAFPPPPDAREVEPEPDHFPEAAQPAVTAPAEELPVASPHGPMAGTGEDPALGPPAAPGGLAQPAGGPQRFPASWAPPPQPSQPPPAAPLPRVNRPPPPMPPPIPDPRVPPDPRALDPRMAGWPQAAVPPPQPGPQAPGPGPGPAHGSLPGMPPALPVAGPMPGAQGSPPPPPWQEPRRFEPQPPLQPLPSQPPPQLQPPIAPPGRGAFPHVPPAQPPAPAPPAAHPPAFGEEPTFEVPPSRGGPAHRERHEPVKRIGAIEIGQLIETLPGKMRKGVAHTVEVRIAKADVRALAEATGQELLVTRAVAVRLRAPDHAFFVETAAPETQWIEPSAAAGMMSDDYASWRWTVTPKKSGKRRRLGLVVAARAIGGDGMAAEASLPERAYEVRVTRNLGQSFRRWSGWLIAAVIGGALVKYSDPILAALTRLVLQSLMGGGTAS